MGLFGTGTGALLRVARGGGAVQAERAAGFRSTAERALPHPARPGADRQTGTGGCLRATAPGPQVERPAVPDGAAVGAGLRARRLGRLPDGAQQDALFPTPAPSRYAGRRRWRLRRPATRLRREHQCHPGKQPARQLEVKEAISSTNV